MVILTILNSSVVRVSEGGKFMKKAISDHPLYFLYSTVEKKKLITGEGKKYLLPVFMAIPFILLLLLGATVVCPCMSFSLACFLQLFLVIALVGHMAVVSISTEREKQTLDVLRLTSLGPVKIVTGKIIPEIGKLLQIMYVTSPFILLMSLIFPGQSILSALIAVFVSFTAGVALICGLVCLSAYCSTASSAIVLSWILRGVWIFITPLIDGLIATATLRSSTIPVFSSINPALPLMAILMPGSMDGTKWIYGAFAFPAVIILFSAVSIILAARRIENDDKISSTRRSSPLGLFNKSTVWNDIAGKFSIFHNPIFLKEMVSFRKDFLGLIPGILVFAILLLAPCFKSYSMKFFFIQKYFCFIYFY